MKLQNRYSVLRFLLLAFLVSYLSACSKISNVRDSIGSSAVRVSVMGDRMPQMAQQPRRPVDTGRLKVYVMDTNDPYRKNLAQEVDMNYRVAPTAPRQHAQAVKQHRPPVRQAAARPKAKPKARTPARVAELPAPSWQKPRVVTRAAPYANAPQQEAYRTDELLKKLAGYQAEYYKPAAIKPIKKKTRRYKSAKKKKSLKKRRVVKRKSRKSRRKSSASKKYAKKSKKRKVRRKTRNKSKAKKKDQWKWDANGRIIRASL